MDICPGAECFIRRLSFVDGTSETKWVSKEVLGKNSHKNAWLDGLLLTWTHLAIARENDLIGFCVYWRNVIKEHVLSCKWLRLFPRRECSALCFFERLMVLIRFMFSSLSHVKVPWGCLLIKVTLYIGLAINSGTLRWTQLTKAELLNWKGKIIRVFCRSI